MIENLNHNNIKDCVELAYALWPDTEYEELLEEFKNIINSDKIECFLYYKNESNKTKEYLGFAQVSIRSDYVEGSESSPVAYLEGIYVKDKSRRRGIGELLVKRAEEWGKGKGCLEMGSDCELDNYMSVDFHKGIGFEEANRLVCFIKKI